MIKKTLLAIVAMLTVVSLTAQKYEPTPEILKAREEFSDARFGVFIHWGIYSMFAQGEWYLQNAGINRDEYAKAADAFYPHRFNAQEWVSAIKAAGAKAGVSMTRIESRPVKNCLGDYRFFIEADCNIASEGTKELFSAIEKSTLECKLIGAYNRG